MANYKVYPLQVGYFKKHPMGHVTYMQNYDIMFPAPILAYLIKGEGVSILVDTGCIEDNPEFCIKYHHEVVQSEETKILNLLAKHGETPDSLDFLINTHLHWDHCYNDFRFPGKKIYLQKKELDYALDPYPFNYLSYETSHVGLRSPFIDVIPQFEFLHGDKTLLPGIQAVTLPGHTPGMQGVLVDSEKGQILIASDCISGYKIWEGNKYQKHFIGTVHTDVAAYYETMDKIDAINPAYILAGHDSAVMEHECYPY